MHPATALSRASSRVHCRKAFTLVEILIASAIGALVLGAILTTYVYCMKGFAAISNYAEIHEAGRITMDWFARDMRGVNAVTFWSSTNLVVTVPTASGSSGNVTSSKTVSYVFKGGALYRADSSTGNTDMMATNIYQLTFALYDHLGSNTVLLTNAKGVQVDIKLRKYVVGKVQSEDYLSGRLDMRNVP
jgi:prepilin-type N-terminal cleavage/methylation domain-containing protein